MARGGAYNTNVDGQELYGRPFGIDYVKVCVIKSIVVNAFLPISSDEMMTIGDAIGSFIA